jgi:hypothetical protein
MPRSGQSSGSGEGPVVVAEEIDGQGQVVRSWFVMLQPNRDGCGLKADCPPHRIVSRDIRPGESTPDYDANNEGQIAQRISEGELIQIRRARDEMIADRERHVIYAQTYLDALKNADGWKGNVEHLNIVVAQKDATIKERDNEIFELKNEVALNRLQIANLQASYAALENRKSLNERVKVWCRSKLKRLKELVSKQAESSDCCAAKCKSATGRNSWRVWFRR